LSREVIHRIDGALNRALANENVRERLKSLGFEAAPMGAQFDAFVVSEVDRYGKFVRSLGLKVE
jgi:tripartite-type tricarboxylate transporter receptor subunit TctC